MDINSFISEIRLTLDEAFTDADAWFDKDETLRAYKPQSGGWTIDQILEHIGLTSHYLLILIEKGTRKALNQYTPEALEEALKTYDNNRVKLQQVGQHKSFEWIRPKHMEPAGAKTNNEVRQQFKDQYRQCTDTLEMLKNGEGVLYKTTMSVADLGKIDVYEYIYFLAQHVKRHIQQMEKNAAEYEASVNK